MTFHIAEGPVVGLEEYARVPISFQVTSVLRVSAPRGGLGGLVLAEEAVVAPYVKGLRRARAPRGVAAPLRRVALGDARRAGGRAARWWRWAPGLDMLEGRSDLAVLWDIRVMPDARGRGVGGALFRAAGGWAAARGCRTLKVETQNVNVPACRLYARQGCRLGAIHRFAYPGLPGEAQLLWYRELNGSPPVG